MEKEDSERLKRILELTEQNHTIVRKMYTQMRWGRFFSFIYWFVIIGVAVGALYFVQPYVTQVQSTYKDLQGSLENIRGNIQSVQGDVKKVKETFPL